ncbi:hypothetical protein M378DRAFT_1056815 [Amanita muscaria Koide BX008]|uniref:Uncharacterized protein n=1 Tax=Amanita muscaria (strain Koide BX008) TaxID=946122 RepID=A0A0C2T5K2_AMAMK|nr:hypothetical protein M378DRAFT_1056815 [Amanita muscaria Koide BX008]
MMSLLKVVVLFFFTTIAFAQGVVINYPQNGASVPAGQDLTVQVVRPDTITGSQEVAVVIGLESCTSQSCPSPVDVMGDILHNGPYNPQFQQPNLPPFQPYQNFTVAIPASWAKGAAQLNVAHFTLIGAGPFPDLETLKVSLTIV